MIHVTFFAISITVYARFSRRINSKKVEFWQEELMDHIMVSINLGSKRSDWEISGTRLLCQDRWWEMWRSISEVFSFRYSGLQQVLFYSFYNTWSMIRSPPATLAVQWVSAGERERLHFLLFMVVLWLLWPHAKVSFSPIELWCIESFIKNWI